MKKIYLPKARPLKNSFFHMFRGLTLFLVMAILAFPQSNSLIAQITPIAVDNNPTNDCSGNDCWDWANWSPDINNPNIATGIFEDNSCPTTITATISYSGPDVTPDFTGTLVGVNTTDGTTPDIWTRM